MRKIPLQWRITLMSVLLIGVTCVAMNLLLCSSGVYYMDTIADSLQGGGTVILNDGGTACFDPQLIAPTEELTIVVDGAQGRFRTTNWYITAAVTLLSSILAYFVSGRALKPLRSFASQVEQVQMNSPEGRHGSQVGRIAGVPPVQPFLQSDAGAAEQRLCRPAAVHRERRPRAAHTAGTDAGAVGTVLRRAFRRTAGGSGVSYPSVEQIWAATQMTKIAQEMVMVCSRWRGTWTFSGVGDRRSPRRLRLGGGKLGQGRDHRGRAAGRGRKRFSQRGYPIAALGCFMMIVFQPPQHYRSSSRSAPCRG